MKNEKPEEEMLNRMKIIKDGLLNNHKGIYSIIVKHFESEIKEFGAKLFASSLADKLKIDVDKINLASLRSAVFRTNSAPKSHLSFTDKKRNENRDIDQDELGFS